MLMSLLDFKFGLKFTLVFFLFVCLFVLKQDLIILILLKGNCPGPVTRLVRALSINQKVAGSIPGRGAHGRQPIDVLLSLCL